MSRRLILWQMRRRTRDVINSLRPLRQRVAAILWVALIIAVFSGGSAMAASTVLDFEDKDIPAGTTVTAQYGRRGVLFQQAFLDTDPAAHSGTRVLRSARLSDEIFTAIPLPMTFTSAQARVKLFAESSFAAANGTLIAFDAANNVVAQDGPKLVAADVFTTVFELIDPDATPSITRVELRVENSAHFAIDDLEFEGEPPGPVPTTPPVVQLIKPLNGVDLDIPGDIPKLDINGTVTGEGLVSPVNATLAYLQPPESTAPPLGLALALTGSGITRQFELPGGIAGVPLGPITVTATAENTGALKGTATSTFTNFPIAIRNRFITEGGAAALGDFQFGLFAGACKIAVYKRAAISAVGVGSVLISGDIFTKWMSRRTPINSKGLGCPLGEERDAVGGSRAQDFEGGRIYAKVTGIAPPGTAYVPAVFVDAIDKRGGELANGIPLTDPSDSIGPASQTWLFQRFFRPEERDVQPSTLEIRSTPPMLWMERQGGAWFLGSLAPSAFDIDRHKSAATLWESFPCSNNLGPCTVDPEPPFPPPNIANAGDLFCNGITYIPTLEGTQPPGAPATIPPEWVSIRGQYDVTPVFGAIISAHMADIDNGFTHETHNGNCPYFPNILEAFSTVTCVSDFEFFVRPIGPQVDTSPLPSLFGKSNTDSIKTEYEVSIAAAAHNFLGAPAVGDLIHTTGRWIIDCGHATYKSELHPIFSFAKMKTVVSETNTFTGLEEDLFGGKPATRIAIWVNGWFPGGDNNAIEFDAFPPPRPSPDAVLHVVKPVDSAPGGYTAAEDVTMEFALVPPGTASHVHLRFTSPRRENFVTGAGEMKFESGRQYWGIWYLYWGQ